MKTLIKIVAYILVVCGVGVHFLFRANVAFFLIGIALILLMVINWDRIKNLDPKRDVSKDIFGMPIIDFREKTERKAQNKLKLKCPQCDRFLRGATKEMVGDIGVCPKCETEFVIGQEDEKVNGQNQ